MTEKPTGPITITLTSEDVQEYRSLEMTATIKDIGLFCFELLREKINAAQSPVPSYTRVQVLQELWEPTELYFRIDPDNSIHGVFNHGIHPNTIERIRKEGYRHAPTKELAEQIVQIRQGKYRPTQQDIDEKVPFWVWDNREGKIRYSGDPCVGLGAGNYLYFFTESQRATFIIKSREAEQAKKEEPRVFPYFFHAEDGEICFTDPNHTTASALNAILSFCREKGFNN